MTSKTWTAPNADLIGVAGGARQVTTPALMLDSQALHDNMHYLMTLCKQHDIQLRPHAKTHKCAEIANQQIAMGALGICCATPHEVIMLAQAGVTQIHLTTPITQARHLQALTTLYAQGLDLMVAIDHPDQIDALNTLLPGHGKPLPVLVDIDIGMGRTGVTSARAAIELAIRVTQSDKLEYAGVQGYSGMVQHINRFTERRAIYGKQLDYLQSVLDELRRAGLAPDIISGGGTGTFGIDIQRGIFTESQAGSYIFMDVEYHDVELFEDRDNPYQTSLFLRTSIVNNKIPTQLTVNAGFKSFATDGPLARIISPDHSESRYELYGDEFGRIVLAQSNAAAFSTQDHIDLMTPHCDPTINLHDCYHVFKGDTLLAIWPIVARGTL